jgi:hypothetical protein
MSRKELIKILDYDFSLFMRLSAADDNGMCRCPTCGKVYSWQRMDLSHYCGRKHLATRWDERNCIVQCQSENRFQSGNIFKLRQVLVNHYGEDVIQEVEKKAVMPWAEDEFSLRMKIIEYREKIKILKLEKGL